MATEPDCDFAGAALQGVITVNGLSIPMTDSKQCVSSCSVAEDVTKEGGSPSGSHHGERAVNPSDGQQL